MRFLALHGAFLVSKIWLDGRIGKKFFAARLVTMLEHQGEVAQSRGNFCLVSVFGALRVPSSHSFILVYQANGLTSPMDGAKIEDRSAFVSRL